MAHIQRGKVMLKQLADRITGMNFTVYVKHERTKRVITEETEFNMMLVGAHNPHVSTPEISHHQYITDRSVGTYYITKYASESYHIYYELLDFKQRVALFYYSYSK